MEREIVQELRTWKQNHDQKVLLLKGARQVGKSYSVLEFIKKEFDSYIEINLENDLYMREVFEKTRKVDEIIDAYQAKYPKVKMIKEKTVLFFDEIQASTNALTSLKFFALEGYHVIASGSLLGVSIAHTTSFPVGYVKTIEMYPMNFKEFLWALGVSQKLIDQIKKSFLQGVPLLEPLHEQLNEYFKQYMICGGMPEVVKKYVQSKDWKIVRETQKQILSGYYADIAKYGDNTEKLKAHECFASIPAQLAKDNKKFQYKLLRNGGNSRIYDSALQWLEDSGILVRVYRLDNLESPMQVHKSLSTFKVYMNDAGLLMAMFEDNLIYKILDNDLLIFKGAIFENVAYQCLRSNHEGVYYYEFRGKYEIDFVVSHNGSSLPIEIKSSTNTKSKSLQAVIQRYQTPLAYKLSMNQLNTQDDVIKRYPLYMLMLI